MVLINRSYPRYCIEDQLSVLKQQLNWGIDVVFEENDKLPDNKDVLEILKLLDDIHLESNEELFTELQILLILIVIQGVDINQALNFQIIHSQKIETLFYSGGKLKIISQNSYCQDLIRSMTRTQKSQNIFQKLNTSNSLNCLNLFLVMNGFEIVLTATKLKLIFGRFHYLRNGRIRGVREFLKEYFSCDSHIDLLVKLRLVDSVHYNTMMRN